MKKIINWLFGGDLDLKNKWWHRFLKVLFIISVISLTIYVITLFANSYPRIVNQWNFVDVLSGRLSKNDNSGKILSMRQLYNDEEIIGDSDIYTKDYFPNLKDKDYLLPFSPIFLEDTESFCSNKLDKQIIDIVNKNNIKLFSTTNPTLNTLSTNIDAFNSYLYNNDIKCVMVDSYSVENENGITSKYTFLRPVDIYKYNVYRYENNFIGFILDIILSIIGLLLYIFIVLFIYNKIILYIIYGNKK
ncbi:MAG: hypothetical protein WC870_00600 [Candidatus Paceibacterota bacterium]